MVRERRNRAQEIYSLVRLLSELSQKSESSEPQTVHVRDSRLAQIVGPLLIGNAKTFFFACLGSEKEEHLSNVNTLRLATKVRSSSHCFNTLASEVEVGIEPLLSKAFLYFLLPPWFSRTGPIDSNTLYKAPRNKRFLS